MIKVAIKYEIFPSINDLNTFISGCYYGYGSDPDRLYFKAGTWQLPQGLLYADNASFKQPPDTISGVGVFKDVNDELPGLIFSNDRQEVFICDKILIQKAMKHLDMDVLFMKIAYEKAFEGTFDFENILNRS